MASPPPPFTPLKWEKKSSSSFLLSPRENNRKSSVGGLGIGNRASVGPLSPRAGPPSRPPPLPAGGPPTSTPASTSSLPTTVSQPAFLSAFTQGVAPQQSASSPPTPSRPPSASPISPPVNYPPPKTSVVAAPPPVIPNDFDPAIHLFPQSLKTALDIDYEIEEKLGMGAFGVVIKARHLITKKVVAVKCIKREDAKPNELLAEVNLLTLLGDYHGIVGLEAVYETQGAVNIVMDYISGGELFDAIVQNEFYSEKDAAKLVQQMVTTVEYVHSRNVVHRDLKPENLLFESPGSTVLKLIDFGIATELPPDGVLYEVVGSRTYMAPEIDRRIGYGKPVDVYAIGVIMYILLCGYPPFDYDQGIYELAFNSPEWDDISDDAKEIITNLLGPDGNARYTSTALKKHLWISGPNAPQRILTNNIQATVRSYMDFNKMKTRLGVGGRDRRMSVYSLFNIAKVSGVPNSAPPALDPQKKLDQERLSRLKMDLRNHSLRFIKLKDDLESFAKETTNGFLEKELKKTVEEVKFLTMAYKELLDSTVPALTKAESKK